MSKKDKKLQNVVGPVKSLKVILQPDKSQSLFGKDKEPSLGLQISSTSSSSGWTVVNSKRTKNKAKLNCFNSLLEF